jgi:hypothetical protein
VVELRDDAQGFAEACELLRGRVGSPPSDALKRILRRNSWDRIAKRMDSLVFSPRLVGDSGTAAAAAEATA